MRRLLLICSCFCFLHRCQGGTLADIYTEDFIFNCDHIYFDIGTNVGVQIRKLYEPELYPDAGVLKIFDASFGKSRQNVCAIGIEPNPRHTPRLEAIEAAYRKKGWRVVILTESAASNQEGTLTFKHDNAVDKRCRVKTIRRHTRLPL